LILCRGVLTSFGSALQGRVTRGLQRALRPWGYLVVGAEEMIAGGQLQRVNVAHPFYRNTGVAGPSAPAAPHDPVCRHDHDPTPPHDPEASHAVAASAAELGAGEHLRATLQELTASRRELDAVRDRLHRTQEDARLQLAALERRVRAQQDLLAATGLAVLFVDRELRVLHYTPPLQELLHVWPHDRGRPIGDLTSCLAGC
jgi:hypothetical protein